MAKKICAHCGTIDNTRREARGSLIGEIGVWLIALLAGPVTAWISVIVAVIFSLWRALDKKPVCNTCGKDELVDTNTPRGKKLQAEYHK